MNHAWGKEAVRELYLTTRTCIQCGMKKLTHHEGAFPTIEWKRGDVTIPGTKTPACAPGAVNVQPPKVEVPF